MRKERLFDIWAKRNPRFERQYDDSIIKLFTDYGRGSSSFQESRGKIFGAGFEIYIVAFFIGLYFDERIELDTNKDNTKSFGHAIQFWGNKETKGLRKNYSKIQQYMFIALVARSEVDFISLDKGDIKDSKVVDTLIATMEEYANFGFSYINDKMKESPGYFFSNSAFLDIFMSFNEEEKDSLIGVESLD